MLALAVWAPVERVGKVVNMGALVLLGRNDDIVERSRGLGEAAILRSGDIVLAEHLPAHSRGPGQAEDCLQEGREAAAEILPVEKAEVYTGVDRRLVVAAGVAEVVAWTVSNCWIDEANSSCYLKAVECFHSRKDIEALLSEVDSHFEPGPAEAAEHHSGLVLA